MPTSCVQDIENISSCEFDVFPVVPNKLGKVVKYEAKNMSIIFLETLNIKWGQIDPKGNRRVNIIGAFLVMVHSFKGALLKEKEQKVTIDDELRPPLAPTVVHVHQDQPYFFYLTSSAVLPSTHEDMQRYRWPGYDMQLLGELQKQQNNAQFCDVLLKTEGELC